jgi:SAM-dependent methyltransferase
MSIQNTIQWYDDHVDDVAPLYEKAAPEQLHRWFSDLLPPLGLVIDVGAGTGRDAAWFASKGLEVVAVEPSAGMRAEANARRPDSNIEWVDDRMPSLSRTLSLGLAADLVFLGAVWMHVPPEDRRRAFRKLVSLTRSGGRIVMSLRKGPDDGRGFYPASVLEIECLARDHGLIVERVERLEDLGGRDAVSWECVVLRLIDDGTGALPLLRHVILNDAKTTTYKLGLLRSLCRVAAGAAGMARETDDDHVNVAARSGGPDLAAALRAPACSQPSSESRQLLGGHAARILQRRRCGNCVGKDSCDQTSGSALSFPRTTRKPSIPRWGRSSGRSPGCLPTTRPIRTDREFSRAKRPKLAPAPGLA